ncbi:ACT domain-containing protein, partial [Turicimonas muris]|uniref:ACT domain-containing protein n=1 Tax=Turicimonas muris TaxID=1796652 RepID=UPI003217A6F4
DKGKVLVVGVDSLLTQLARCCHPVPPDPIVGFVTRGRGVIVHRADCPNIRNLDDEGHDRLIEVSWTTDTDVSYPVEILIIAIERVGLLRDISEVFSKEKQPVVAMNSSRNKGDLHFNFTIEIKNSEDLKRTLNALREIKNVVSARRK